VVIGSPVKTCSITSPFGAITVMRAGRERRDADVVLGVHRE
jgi:hypothetical protein